MVTISPAALGWQSAENKSPSCKAKGAISLSDSEKGSLDNSKA